MDAETVAKELTPTQARLVEWLDTEEFYDWGSTGWPGNRKTRMILLALGLTERGDKDWMRRLSPFGKTVRALLKGE